MSTLIQNPTRILFFTGKGGVGKTSSACATAIGLADAGKRVLLVSTDPASNLDEVLGVKLSSTPTLVPNVPGLSALNIDPEQAAHDYRERVVGPYRGVLPAVAVASMEEQLSGACTVEIAAFDEFSKLLGDKAATAAFDHVIFDTAPTGHTLRLLELPAAWSNFIDTNVGGTSCLGPLSGLNAQRVLYAASNEALRDPTQTILVLVARPDRSSFTEAERTRAELVQLGVGNVRLILNGVFHAREASDSTAVALAARGRAALEELPLGLRGLQRVDVPLLPFGLVGVDALRKMGTMTEAAFTSNVSATASASREERLNDLVDELAKRGKGVVVGEAHPAVSVAAEGFGGEERGAADVPERAGFFAFVLAAERLRGIFDDEQAVVAGDFLDRVVIGGQAEEIDRDDAPGGEGQGVRGNG